VTRAYVPSAEQIAREEHVLELRRAGVSFARIAEQVGVNDKSQAHKIYRRALARTLQEPAAEIRELEAERLDRLQVAVWTKALKGDLGAVDRVLRVMERRARLLGLDHADGIAERALQLEAARVRLVALAFGKVLDELKLPEPERERLARILLTEMRALEAAEDQHDVVTGEAS
jgi:hypothetical protein